MTRPAPHVQVIADPAAVADAHRAVERRAEDERQASERRIEALVAALNDEACHDIPGQAEFTGEERNRLTALLAARVRGETPAGPRARLLAYGWLARSGHRESACDEAFVTLIRESPTGLCGDALAIFASHFVQLPADVVRRLHAPLMSLLDDPRVPVRAAAVRFHAGCTLAHARFREILADAPLELRHEILIALGRHGRDTWLLDFLQSRVRFGPIEAHEEALVLGWFVEHGTTEERERALDVLRELCERHGPRSRQAFMGLMMLVDHVRPSDLSLLEKVLDGFGNADPYFRYRALGAVVRRSGPGARQRLLSRLEDPVVGVEAARLLASGEFGPWDEELVDELRRVGRSQRDPWFHWTVAEQALAARGDACRRLAARMALHCAGTFRLDLAWRIAGFDAAGAIAVLRRLHLVGDDVTPESSKPSGVPGSDRPVRAVARAFRAAGRLAEFCDDTCGIPARHDRLVQTFAAATSGAFRPEALLETLDRAGDVEETSFASDYTVQFVAADRLYRVRAFVEDDDVFDHGAMATAVNRALEDSGRRERLIWLERGSGQRENASYVFAEPGAFARACDEIGIAVPGGPDVETLACYRRATEFLEAIVREG
jgi:hypothetical protein